MEDVKVKRYDPDEGPAGHFLGMQKCADGDFVKYDDYVSKPTSLTTIQRSRLHTLLEDTFGDTLSTHASIENLIDDMLEEINRGDS